MTTAPVRETDGMKPRFTIEERADRFQRRYTGPWRTEAKGIVQVRYRRRPRIEFVRFSVACHDLWTHALWRGVIVPTLTPFVRWLAAWLDRHPAFERRTRWMDRLPDPLTVFLVGYLVLLAVVVILAWWHP